MKTIPFFHRSMESPETDDITITTLVTPNRYEILRKLAEQYDVTVHITFPSPSAKSDLAALLSLLSSSPALATRADIHLVLSPFPRAFNAWRNLARLAARTEYVLTLDADFAVCTDWRKPVRAMVQDEKSTLGKLVREGEAALVLPAFEYTREREGKDQTLFPRDKGPLLELVRTGRIAPFHAAWAPGHNSTDYKRFTAAQAGEIYKVTTYQSAYEPYVIVRKDAGGWCDERFTGYGGNKAACLFEMYLSGVSFYVLGDHFLIHQSHAYEEEARKSERKYNRRIYADFKEETCLRYIHRLREERALKTARAQNALHECAKIKSISKLVTQVRPLPLLVSHYPLIPSR
ncbi:glycosyl-transferase for dystroglycan-domain-containing protein [Vararia minispora EC-137]|uniref:Glycosyl-transferase for dystroglycan-domain-containing protein n=1 Tax=Vararia minispora EC-137 TaxID=1314806 RepID=A0ACB8QSA6_9AGAM|nr:glycosyl-transferase for dystroglycan-domain-containing protein [Vararia minispora EC-137]